MKSGQAGHNLPSTYPVNNTGTPQCETASHPFIVRIWLEETAEEAGEVIWRGHITHVPSGERLYLTRLEDITAFIAPYLDQMGVKLGLFWRVGKWLNRWK